MHFLAPVEPSRGLKGFLKGLSWAILGQNGSKNVVLAQQEAKMSPSNPLFCTIS